MKNYHLSGIPTWAVEDRPREKLLSGGVQNLSDTELLAVIIASGTRNQSAVDLAREILKNVDYDLHRLSRLSVQELGRLKGIGPAKAVKIISAMELGTRKHHSKRKQMPRISSSNDVYRIFQPLIGELEHEEFWILILNRSNTVLGKTKISQGGLSGTVIDTRLILKNAIDRLATSIIACHNHPSGNIQPSEADKKITASLKNSAEMMEIKFLDHIIIADRNYFSFADEGLL
ncbi:MAG TPA: DNA repair protein RadC [Bacteroidaceae bacterium]|nr:DNA repair protein RadC [Bacteroidaceae bacterium]